MERKIRKASTSRSLCKNSVSTAPRDETSMTSSFAAFKLLSSGAYPRVWLPIQTRLTEPKRGPDGIRTHICHRREVLCYQLHHGPFMFVSAITTDNHFDRPRPKSGNTLSLLKLIFTRSHGLPAHPQFRDHRAHRPRQIDARRPPARVDRIAHRARDAGTGARFHGSRTRTRHHHQGPRRPHDVYR